MRIRNVTQTLALLAGASALSASAGDLGINVVLSGELSPGVYGQVEIGNRATPRVVYEQPRVIVVDKRYRNAAPVYLHVPPGHIKHWDKHCEEYHACARKVYFVRSEEYDRYEESEHEHHQEHGHSDHHGGHGNHGNGEGKHHDHD